MDLLRVILSVMVIALHFCNSNGGGGFTYSNGNPAAYEFMLLLESVSICAVNCFMMLSGYFQVKSQKRTIRKPIFMMGAVVCYNALFYVIDVFLGNPFSVSSLIRMTLPINYFAWLYCTVYLISPWINLCLVKLSKKEFRFMLAVMSVLFVVWPTVVGMYTGITGTTILGISTVSASDHGAGYTLVQFVMGYLFGAYLQLHKTSLTARQCSAGYLVSCAVTFLLIHLSMAAIEYSSVFVVASAFFLTAAFTKWELHLGSVCTALASQSFNVFLTHGLMHGLWERMPLAQLGESGILQTALLTLWAVAAMYAASLAISIVTSKLIQPVRTFAARLLPMEYTVKEDL